jgi:hypothetical protein
MNIRAFVVGVVVSLMVCAEETSAQSVSPPPSADWQFEFVPYLWGSGMKGVVGIGSHSADIDASFSDILSHLHFAAMGLTEARRGRLVSLTDLVYTDLRGQHATPGPLFSSVNPKQRLFILTPAAGVRLVDADGATWDLVGGVRFWHSKSELQFGSGVLPGVDMEASRNWVDAIAGVRARMALSSNWWAGVYGDVGGGGSDVTFQLNGTAGWDIGPRYALVIGYRYLDVDYDNDDVLLDTAIKGPLFGFIFKW